MFARAVSFSVLALPLLATAVAFPGGSPPPPTCAAGTGSLQCCNNALQSTNPVASLLLTLLGIVDTVTGLVGITCVADVVGTCSQQSVCCTNNTFNGVVALGCTNINL